MTFIENNLTKTRLLVIKIKSSFNYKYLFSTKLKPMILQMFLSITRNYQNRDKFQNK
jgi:hypothetical protein